MIRRSPLVLALMLSLTACAAEPPARAPAAAANAPASVPAKLDEAAVRAAMKALAPDATIDQISASPLAGFSEVAIGGRVVYVSNDGQYLMQGALLHIPDRANLTLASEGALRKQLLDKAGPDRRIIFAAAKPEYRITVFTDIDCGYCRKLHEQMADYNKLGISVEYLFFPREGIGSEGFEKAVSVWCAPDRRKALTAAKAGAELPKGTCTNPVTMDYDLGRKAGVDGTPAIYAPNGVQLGGYLSPEDMLARLKDLDGQGKAKAGP
ncbi:thioredoxin fold domain-containing protein [Arenimonas sp. MALMAid1274]|uniref:thioredoxin fold domain-containing protein n=1 Tax=Arenimonas sp. MALMAid1274 TaxID=3411630 RepID=UPI003BA06429